MTSQAPAPRADPTRSELLGLFALVGLMFWDRVLILQRFAFQYVDRDQALMWYGARELMHFRLHEPCFYGQSYNSLFESLCALPLLLLGLPFHVALPVATSLLTLAPFVLLAAVSWREGEILKAATLLSLPLLLPLEYGMLTSMPRGFVTGTFFAALGAVAVVGADTRLRPATVALASFCLVVGLWANPNAALVALPLLGMLAARVFSNRRLLLAFLIGLLPGCLVHGLSRLFYALHPAYDIFGQARPSFAPNRFVAALGELDRFFGSYAPLAWGQGWIAPFLLATLVALLIRQRRWAWALALSAGTSFTLLALGLDRVHQGIDNIYWSSARMFVAVPVLVALGLGAVRFPVRHRHMLMAALVACASASVAVKGLSLDDRIRPHLRLSGPVTATSISELERTCQRLASISRQRQIALVVLGFKRDVHIEHEVAYACPCLEADLPETLLLPMERRTWRLLDEWDAVRDNILFAYALQDVAPERLAELRIERLDDDLYVLEGNQRTLGQLLEQVGLKTPRLRLRAESGR